MSRMDSVIIYTHWDIIEASGLSGNKRVSNDGYFPICCWIKKD